MFNPADDRALIVSSTASAWERSNRPLRKARFANSPGSAIRAPEPTHTLPPTHHHLGPNTHLAPPPPPRPPAMRLNFHHILCRKRSRGLHMDHQCLIEQ